MWLDGQPACLGAAGEGVAHGRWAVAPAACTHPRAAPAQPPPHLLMAVTSSWQKSRMEARVASLMLLSHTCGCGVVGWQQGGPSWVDGWVVWRQRPQRGRQPHLESQPAPMQSGWASTHLADLKVLALDLLSLALQHGHAVCGWGATMRRTFQGEQAAAAPRMLRARACMHACMRVRLLSTRASPQPLAQPCCPEHARDARGSTPAPRPTHSCLRVTSSSNATRTSQTDTPSLRKDTVKPHSSSLTT